MNKFWEKPLSEIISELPLPEKMRKSLVRQETNVEEKFREYEKRAAETNDTNQMDIKEETGIVENVVEWCNNGWTVGRQTIVTIGSKISNVVMPSNVNAEVGPQDTRIVDYEDNDMAFDRHCPQKAGPSNADAQADVEPNYAQHDFDKMYTADETAAALAGFDQQKNKPSSSNNPDEFDNEQSQKECGQVPSRMPVEMFEPFNGQNEHEEPQAEASKVDRTLWEQSRAFAVKVKVLCIFYMCACPCLKQEEVSPYDNGQGTAL